MHNHGSVDLLVPTPVQQVSIKCEITLKQLWHLQMYLRILESIENQYLHF
jgi:hypothetical protein